jgi:hypothetical protein
MMTSNGSPASIFLIKVGGSSNWVASLCPVARSNCGASVSKALRAAPVTKAVISAAVVAWV